MKITKLQLKRLDELDQTVIALGNALECDPLAVAVMPMDVLLSRAIEVTSERNHAIAVQHRLLAAEDHANRRLVAVTDEVSRLNVELTSKENGWGHTLTENKILREQIADQGERIGMLNVKVKHFQEGHGGDFDSCLCFASWFDTRIEKATEEAKYPLQEVSAKPMAATSDTYGDSVAAAFAHGRALLNPNAGRDPIHDAYGHYMAGEVAGNGAEIRRDYVGTQYEKVVDGSSVHWRVKQ